MRFGTRRSSDTGRIDSGDGRGVQLSASEASTPRRRRTEDEDDDAVIEKPATFDDFDEFSEDNDATPDDRRRDPLRKNF